jgi:hypothetical protein
MLKECISNTPLETVWCLTDKAGHILGKAIVDNKYYIEYYSLWKKYSREQIKAMFKRAKVA